jgi:hypothetical protein
MDVFLPASNSDIILYCPETLEKVLKQASSRKAVARAELALIGRLVRGTGVPSGPSPV